MQDNFRPCIAVWTRDLNSADLSGRTNLLRAVKQVLADQGPLKEFTAPTVFSAYGRSVGLSVFAFAILSSCIKLKPLPLQCALYASITEISPDMLPPKGGIVVVDSIRQLLLVEALRRRDPALRIIVDMDDLMSRRVRLLLENGFEVSLGAFSAKMPNIFARLLSSGWLSKALMRYEAKALAAAEARLCAVADDVVTVSQLEAETLRKSLAAHARSRVIAVAPQAKPPAVRVTPFACDRKAGPIRFVFVGSDVLIQNRSSIDWLQRLWETSRPNADLIIFGSQTRAYHSLPPRMKMRGFVSSLAEVYDGRSVLLCPTFMGGGVKTKVLEAFMHGAPVVGNDLTYEGISTQQAFLTFETPGLAQMFTDPESARRQLYEAAISGQREVSLRYGPIAFSANWTKILSQENAASAVAPSE